MSPPATLVRVSYGDAMADDPPTWPEAGRELIRELAASRDRFAIIAGLTPSTTDGLVEQLGDDLGLAVVRLGAALADRAEPPTLAHVEAACRDATVIADLELLMWPEVRIAPLQFLFDRARSVPTIGVWPGDVVARRAIYSEPGRPDHHDIALRDVVVLRPRTTRFPDEVPFTIERIVP